MEPGSPSGLVVFGTHRANRPALTKLPQLLPEYAHLVAGILDGHGLRAT